MIVIIDYDIGNLAAVSNMLTKLGIQSKITADPNLVDAATHLILPGNGSFDACMLALKQTKLIPQLQHRVFVEKIPLLGICVGAQMLGHSSEEGSEEGLGWMDIQVKRFPNSPGLPVPHMGWNQVYPCDQEHPVTRQMDPDSRFYFVHSYYMSPADQRDVLLAAQYGFEFAAAVATGNITGVQFHPEKSHRFGKKLFQAFVRG